RIRVERRALDRHDFLHGCRGEFRRHSGDIRAQNKNTDRLIALCGSQLLRAGDRLPRGAIELSGALLTDHENHWITLASSLRTLTSSLAASAGDPEIMCVFLAFSGGYSARMRVFVAAAAAAGSGDLRISFFFAAMIPLSVA